MSTEAIILLVSSVLIIILVARYFRWSYNYPVYIIFFSLFGLVNTLISTILVVSGYLEFPWRIFDRFILTNIIYDFIILPGFALLLIELGQRKRKLILVTVLFTAFTTVQDYLLDRYTTLLNLQAWTLIHTAISSLITLILWIYILKWLKKHFGRYRM